MFKAINTENLISTYLVPWGINLGLALLIFFVGRLVSKVLVKVIKNILSKSNLNPILIDFIGSIANAILLLVVIIASLNQLGVDTTSLIALIGVAGLAIGLSLQGSLQNFAAGVMLITFRPFKAGDYVEAGGTSGVIEKINIFSTTMRTPDNKEVIVPNGRIYDDIITNYSARDTRWVDMVFGISYEDDIKKAKKIINDIILTDTRILEDPEPVIAVGELADSSVNIYVRPWVGTDHYWPVYFELNEKIKYALDNNGISIPYPQMDVHMMRVVND
jgi:small conductance mechanosensitive channel